MSGQDSRVPLGRQPNVNRDDDPFTDRPDRPTPVAPARPRPRASPFLPSSAQEADQLSEGSSARRLRREEPETPRRRAPLPTIPETEYATPTSRPRPTFAWRWAGETPERTAPSPSNRLPRNDGYNNLRPLVPTPVRNANPTPPRAPSSPSRRLALPLPGAPTSSTSSSRGADRGFGSTGSGYGERSRGTPPSRLPVRRVPPPQHPQPPRWHPTRPVSPNFAPSRDQRRLDNRAAATRAQFDALPRPSPGDQIQPGLIPSPLRPHPSSPGSSQAARPPPPVFAPDGTSLLTRLCHNECHDYADEVDNDYKGLGTEQAAQPLRR